MQGSALETHPRWRPRSTSAPIGSVSPWGVYLYMSMVETMKVILRHKDLHAYGKICESVHKTASANKICKRKRSFAKV